jgi:hypothetical protein
MVVTKVILEHSKAKKPSCSSTNRKKLQIQQMLFLLKIVDYTVLT